MAKRYELLTQPGIGLPRRLHRPKYRQRNITERVFAKQGFYKF